MPFAAASTFRPVNESKGISYEHAHQAQLCRRGCGRFHRQHGRHRFNMREPLSIGMLKSGRVNFHLARFLFFVPAGGALAGVSSILVDACLAS